jgi:outer membrane lipoprotein-sorting protein
MLGILVTLTSATHPAEAKANAQLLTGILQKMEKAHANLKSLKAAIMQQKVNTQINTKDTDYGVLIYKPSPKGQSRLRIDYNNPETRTVSVVGNNFVFYQPRINQALKTTLAKAAKGRTGGYAQLIGLDSSLKAQASNYNIEYVKDEVVDGRMTTQLHLVPKQGGSVASIEIWVSHETWLPVQEKIVERNGDYMLVKLSNVERDIKLPDEAFNVQYPKGTVVVDKI